MHQSCLTALGKQIKSKLTIHLIGPLQKTGSLTSSLTAWLQYIWVARMNSEDGNCAATNPGVAKKLIDPLL